MGARLFASVLSVLMLLPAAARGNTTILALLAPSALYIAADSKVVGLHRPDFEPGCKILATGKYVFAGAGLLEEKPGPFNIDSFARAAIAKGGDLSRVVRIFVHLTARALPRALARIERAAPSVYSKRLFRQHAVSAIFGTAERGRVRTAIVDFVPESVTNIRVNIRECPGSLCSETKYFFEALGVHAAIDATLKRHPNIWREKGVIPALNYLIIEEVSAEPRLVAPPIAVVVLHANGQIRWVQKGAC